MLPLLMLSDHSLDFKSLFLMANMMNQDCQVGMNQIIPLLLMDDESDNKNLMFYMMTHCHRTTRLANYIP